MYATTAHGNRCCIFNTHWLLSLSFLSLFSSFLFLSLSLRSPLSFRLSLLFLLSLASPLSSPFLSSFLLFPTLSFPSSPFPSPLSPFSSLLPFSLSSLSSPSPFSLALPLSVAPSLLPSLNVNEGGDGGGLIFCSTSTCIFGGEGRRESRSEWKAHTSKILHKLVL